MRGSVGKRAKVQAMGSADTSATMPEEDAMRRADKAEESGDFNEAEKILGEWQLNRSLMHESTSALIAQLQSKSQRTFFDKPVDADTAPGYYADSLRRKTAWDTEAVCFQSMAQKAKEGKYDVDTSARVSKVAFDLKLMVFNAIIYNPATHVVNKAALQLLKASRSVLAKWEKGELMCRVCHGDEVYIENPVQICDFCCTGIHAQCLPEVRREEQGWNPLMEDTAWFCSEACEHNFKRLADMFQLPPAHGGAAMRGGVLGGKSEADNGGPKHLGRGTTAKFDGDPGGEAADGAAANTGD